MSASSSAHYPHHSGHATAEKVRSSFADLWFPSSTLKLLLFALVFGLLIVGVSVGLDYFLLSEHDSPRAIVELSDGFTGLVAGVLVYRVLSYGRNRRQRVAQVRMSAEPRPLERAQQGVLGLAGQAASILPRSTRRSHLLTEPAIPGVSPWLRPGIVRLSQALTIESGKAFSVAAIIA